MKAVFVPFSSMSSVNTFYRISVVTGGEEACSSTVLQKKLAIGKSCSYTTVGFVHRTSFYGTRDNGWISDSGFVDPNRGCFDPSVVY
jgi:hypothetical protein